jgi:hypothetical protein
VSLASLFATINYVAPRKAIVDAGSWVEYGELAVANQLGRQTQEALERRTQRDGLVAGIGRVNTKIFLGAVHAGNVDDEDAEDADVPTYRRCRRCRSIGAG